MATTDRDETHKPNSVFALDSNEEISKSDEPTTFNPVRPKAISSPFSTGSGGSNFENKVQAVFVIMMLTGANAPCLPPWPIVRIKLQGRYASYNTDDFILFVEERNGTRGAKLLAQIKHGVAITENDTKFGETISAAWSDYNNRSIFDPLFDQLALISDPLSASDTEHARTLLEWARTCETHEEFFTKVGLGKFSSSEKQRKLLAFRNQLKKANGDTDVGDDTLFQFLRRFHILGFDLDGGSSTSLALAYSLLSVFRTDRIPELFGAIAQEVSRFNQSAGMITLDQLPIEITDEFVIQKRITIPKDLVAQSNTEELTGDAAEAVVFASLLGSWNENVPGDHEIMRELMEKK